MPVSVPGYGSRSANIALGYYPAGTLAHGWT